MIGKRIPKSGPLSYVDVGVSRGSDWSSALIGWWGAGFWSHEFNLVPFGEAIEQGQPTNVQCVLDSRSDKVGDRPPGVHARPISYLENTERLIIRVPTKESCADLWLAKGVKEIGKPYNMPGILDFLQGPHRSRDRNWRDPSMWFCSELGAHMLEGGHVTHNLAADDCWITPGDVSLIASAYGEVIAHLMPGTPFVRQ